MSTKKTWFRTAIGAGKGKNSGLHKPSSASVGKPGMAIVSP